MKYLAALTCVLALYCGVLLPGASAKLHKDNGYNVSWASWYGPGLYGNRMGCGGRLTTSTWGVAHKSLPCGTHVRMCYTRCVTVTVVDRGPYIAGREFDVTFPVKSAIGMPSVGKIRWWRLS